jgi:hypothetical protein
MLVTDVNNAWYSCGGKKIRQACMYVVVRTNEKMRRKRVQDLGTQ